MFLVLIKNTCELLKYIIMFSLQMQMIGTEKHVFSIVKRIFCKRHDAWAAVPTTREVSERDARQLAEDHGMFYIETSAASGAGVRRSLLGVLPINTAQTSALPPRLPAPFLLKEHFNSNLTTLRKLF